MKKQLECRSGIPSICRATDMYYQNTMTITLGFPMESISQYSGFMMMMMLNHRKRMLNESSAMAASELNKCSPIHLQ